MRDVNDRFIDAFEEIIQMLRQPRGAPGGTSSKEQVRDVLIRARQQGLIGSADQVFLEDCVPLRNSLAHHRVNGRTMLVVTDEVVTRTEQLRCRLVGALPTVERFRRPVVTVEQDATLADACAIMKEHDFSALPVVSDAGVHGLLSGIDIICWVGARLGDNFLLEDTAVAQVMGAHVSVDYRIVRCDTPCHDIPAMFAEGIGDGSVLGAVLITHSGKSREPLLGIVTPWDAAQLR